VDDGRTLTHGMRVHADSDACPSASGVLHQQPILGGVSLDRHNVYACGALHELEDISNGSAFTQAIVAPELFGSPSSQGLIARHGAENPRRARNPSSSKYA
jgi:hypothetical protein